MTSSIILLASLMTAQPEVPSDGDHWPVTSCNKQGTVFDTVWYDVGSSGSTTVYHQRTASGGTLSDSSATALASYSPSPPNLVQPNPLGPAVVVDTDDSSSTDPNYAVAWCVSEPPNPPPPISSYPVCSVNGNTPFTVGNGLEATSVWVAVCRKLVTYQGSSVMAVAVVFEAGYIYAQVFLVNPSTGQPVASSTPALIVWGGSYGSSWGTLNLGGVAGDDYGNFVATYVRQATAEQSGPLGIFAWGFNYQALLAGTSVNLLNGQSLQHNHDAEFLVSTQGNTFTYSRVACYHGTSATNGGFVVAYGGNLSNSGPAILVQRYTTNWSSSATLVAGPVSVQGGDQIPGDVSYAAWMMACARDTPGTYAVSWVSSYQQIHTANVVYATVVGDRANAPIYVTTYVDYPGTDTPTAFGLWPAMAVGDISQGGHALIPYVYAYDNTGGDVYPGDIESYYYTL